MRGKGCSPLSVSGTPGITPAYAGKSHLHAAPVQTKRDHPRVCGEKRWRSCRSATTLGSPPRMRGKEYIDSAFDLGEGITPAYAGKRPWAGGTCFPHRDHPRVCGEKVNFLTLYGMTLGSPPRMRGKESYLGGDNIGAGITPAYAGKSKTLLFLLLFAWDHPRVCGEKRRSNVRRAKRQGSPPRMRGKDHRPDRRAGR